MAETILGGHSVDVNDRLVEYMHNCAKDVLEGLPPTERVGVYAVSFFVYDEDDDPRLPTLTIGTNNEAQVQRMVPEASDAAEARWNFAFWMQNALRIVGGSMDPEGKTLIDKAFEVRGLSFADEDTSPEADRVAAEMTKIFVRACVAVAQQLHRGGVLPATFGRAIPIVVHELEYYDEIAEQTREANPAGLVDDFARWVDSF